MKVSQQKPQKGFWSRVALFLLSKTNPHSKRILLLTSLYCRISHIDRMRDEAIDHLNSLLTLARRREALNLPAAAQDLIWEGDGVETVMREGLSGKSPSPDTVLALSKRLVGIAPQSFHYADTEQMVTDVNRMLADILQPSECKALVPA